MAKFKRFDSCTLQEQIARWNNVIRVLEALPPHERRNHWDMSTWGHKTECGTVACAGGHCGVDPWFNKHGLKLTIDNNYLSGSSTFGDMVIRFFGDEGSDAIFGNSDQRSVSQVIREVKIFIHYIKAKHEVLKALKKMEGVGINDFEPNFYDC